MFHKLESLRGVAACLVVLFHSPFAFYDRSTAFVAGCYLFVDFFFILSGFVMAHAYGERIGNGLGFGNYIALRLGRLYPLHLFMLLVWLPFILVKQYLYLQGFGGRDQFVENDAGAFIANLLLLHSTGVTDALSWNQPSWSISAEFIAYLTFYALACTLDRRARLRVPVLIALGSYAVLFALWRRNFDDFTYYLGCVRCLGAFYLGVLMYRIRPAVARWRAGRARNALEPLAALALAAGVAFAADSRALLALTLLAFCLALLVFASEQSGWLGRRLQGGVLRRLGLWSYSIYMVHKLILVAVSNVLEYGLGLPVKEPWGMASLPLNALLLLATIAVSRFTYVHVEKRFRDLVRLRLERYRAAEQPAA